jgi:hypothetical protein
MATVSASQRQLIHTSNTYESNGDVTVGGNLQVNGTTMTVDTANLLVEDHNIVIGNVASPTDTTADGGGITLKGATDKTINWVNSTDAWTFSDKISVPSLYLTSNPSLSSESTALFINASNQVGYRELGSNAFTSTTIPTNNNQLTNGAGYITGNQTITLSGDASGSGTTSIAVTVANDSHTHDGRYFTETESDARFWRTTQSLNLLSVTDGSATNPFDDSHSETKIAASGTYALSYSGASAHMISSYAGGSASVFQLGAHYNGDDFYMRVRTDSSNWKNWRKLFHENYHPNADKLTTARSISLTGAVTGSTSFDGSGNVSIATTATADPTLTLAGDASGSATFTNLGNATLTVTVADDSHNHIISNIDGLQTALDGKATAGDENIIDGATSIWNADGDGDVFAYDDSNPTHNGKYVGAIIDIRGDGSSTNSLVKAGIFTSNHVSTTDGYYVGTILGATNSTTTQVINSSGAWVGSAIGDSKISSASNWNTAYGWGNHASAGYLTGNQTITLSGDVSGSGTTSISVSLANDSVGAAEIAANAVGASELNVSGNGTTAQFLRSDGDGTFTWATPTDTNTTYSAGNGISLSGTTFSVAAGGGLSQDASGLSHSDTSTQASVNNSNGTVIQDITLDTYGHITAIGSYNLDSRYFTEAEINSYFKRGYSNQAVEASSLTSGAWYTIAQNTGDRAIARFGLRDGNSGDHQSVIFYAAHHFGTDGSNTITVLHNSHFGGSPFRYIRIKDGGTYDGAVLQVYLDNEYDGGSVSAYLLGDDIQNDGWDLVDWLADATAPSNVSNYSSFVERGKIDLDQIAQGGIATTGPIYGDGDTTQYRMFNDNYHPNADKLTTARNIALTGAVTGNANFDGSGNISIATTATADPTLTLAGDASGSATFTNLGNATLTVTVADDSHNHIISNVDGLQTALDGKASSSHSHSNATTSTAGFMSNTDKSKLDGIASGANNYSLPEATATSRGGIELFSNTDQSVSANSVSSTAGRTYGIQLNSAGQAVVNVPWSDTNTTYSVGDGGLTEKNFTSALNTKLAGIETGATGDQTAAEIRTLVESATDSNVFTDADHTKLNGIATNANNYSLPAATSTVRGGIELYSDTLGGSAQSVTSTSNRYYGIQVDSSGRAMVNVPWTNVNSSYLTQDDYEAIHWKQTGRIFTPQCTPLFYNSSGTAGTLAAICFSRTETTTTANAWAQANLYRGITNEVSWSGGGIEFARKLGVSFRCAFLASGTQAQSIRFMVGGRANSVQAAGSNPIVSRGFGVEIRSRTGTTLEWRVFAHNGTSFSASSWSDIPSNATSVYTKELYIYSDGSGNIEAGIDDRGGDGSTWTTKSTTGGPTANGNSTYPYITHEVVNAASGSSYARARVYDYKIFSE